MALVALPRTDGPSRQNVEVAAFFRVTPGTVRGWLCEGWLQPVRRPGMMRFLPEETEASPAPRAKAPPNGAFAKSGEAASRGTG